MFLWFVEPVYSIGGLIMLVLGAIAYQQYREHQKELEKLEWYKKRIKNIFVKSEYPGDTTVIKRCKEHIDWLIKSGNGLRGATKSVKVYGVAHKDLDVVCFWLEDSPNESKVKIAKKRINVDKTGENEIESFDEDENPEVKTYPKRFKEFVDSKRMERAAEVRFNITDNDIKDYQDKNEEFWETQWLKQE